MTGERIEVFADVACPFTHVGLHRLAARRGPPPPHLWVRAWPLELVNGQPLDPYAVAEKVEALRAQVAPDLFRGFDPRRFPATSLPAMTLEAAAHQRNPEVGEAVSLELRELVFELGQDIADPDVLATVAERHGLDGVDLTDPAPVLADHAEGIARGVQGSPYFFTPAGGFFCPTLDIQHDDEGHLQIEVDRSRLEDFLSVTLR